MLGPSLLAAPVVTQLERDTTGLAKRTVHLPAGCAWYDAGSGQCYGGGAAHVLHVPLETLPLFAPEGTVLPLASVVGDALAESRGRGISHPPSDCPSELEVRFFAGRDGHFEMYEDNGGGCGGGDDDDAGDDGETVAGGPWKCFVTRMEQAWSESELQILIAPPLAGDSSDPHRGGEIDDDDEEEEEEEAAEETVGAGGVAGADGDVRRAAGGDQQRQRQQQRRRRQRRAGVVDVSFLPARRTYVVNVLGIAAPDHVTAAIDGDAVPVETFFDAAREMLTIRGVAAAPDASVSIRITREGPLLWRRNRVRDTCRAMLRAFRLDARVKREIDLRLDEMLADTSLLDTAASWGMLPAQRDAFLDAMRTGYALTNAPEHDRWPPSLSSTSVLFPPRSPVGGGGGGGRIAAFEK
jgi:hypothetical protein